MASIPGDVTNYVIQLLKADARVGASLHGRILRQNASAELTERATAGKYPALTVYCDKLTNSLRQKFLAFSGTARMALELRCSADRLETLETDLELRTDAICKVLTASRGDWGDGMFYAGGFEVVFGPVKSGGSNFLQTAKIVFEVEVNR